MESLGDRKFDHGLDVGCGTGISTYSLSRYCSEVHGIDPSRKMLERAEETGSIRFSWFDGEKIPFPGDEFDVITFAGSLFYTNRQLILPEVYRVLTNRGVILVYDFKINLDDVLERLGFEIPLTGAYDHNVNFDDLHPEKLIRQRMSSSMNGLQVTIDQLFHLLFSEEHIANQFMELIPDGAPELIMNRLKDAGLGNATMLPVHSYFTRYQYRA
jgi:ubiquinone/menaquinone biosynthesis C-methylase UbiE